MAVASALQIILPKKRANPKGVAQDPTFNASNAKTTLSAPTYRDHLTDIFDSRQSTDSRALIQTLFRTDPDMSATVNAYLTVASSVNPWWVVYDANGVIDPTGQQQIQSIIDALFSKNDYSLGFQLKPNMVTFFNELRYMALLRGGIATELVLDKTMIPTELRHVDLTTVQWKEAAAGQLKPVQVPAGSNTEINLDIPTFFVSFFKRDPTGIYSYSPFISSINTIAARQQVVNDLYRIMKQTGYPRMEVTVVEEVIRKNAPADAQTDENLMKDYVTARMGELASTISGLSVDQAFVHPDSLTIGMINDKMPGMAVDINPVIDVLNDQNQAALKTMATIIGRGTAGVNTASVESRLFAMHADALNDPIAQMMGDILTLAMRLAGSQSRVEFGFDKVELRTALETEPQKTMLQNRLLALLSFGLISDDTFHMEMFGTPRPPDIPELSGTGFFTPAPASTNPEGGSGDPSSDGQSQSGPVERAANKNGKGAGMATSSASTKRAAK